MKSLTVEEVWSLAWPDVPWDEASPEDKRMFTLHTGSLNFYLATRD